MRERYPHFKYFEGRLQDRIPDIQRKAHVGVFNVDAFNMVGGSEAKDLWGCLAPLVEQALDRYNTACFISNDVLTRQYMFENQGPRLRKHTNHFCEIFGGYGVRSRLDPYQLLPKGCEDVLDQDSKFLGKLGAFTIYQGFHTKMANLIVNF